MTALNEILARQGQVKPADKRTWEYGGRPPGPTGLTPVEPSRLSGGAVYHTGGGYDPDRVYNPPLGGSDPITGMAGRSQGAPLGISQAGRVPSQGPAPLLATAGGNPSGNFMAGQADPNQAVVQGSVPTTGVYGSEQALGAASRGLSQAGTQARGDINRGYGSSQQNLEGGYRGIGQAGTQARNDINRGIFDSRQQLEEGFQGISQAGTQARGDINRGLYDSSQSLRSGSEMVGQAGSRSINDFLGGTQQGRQDINRSSQAALQPLSRFAQSGQDANALQANLLGANGPAAQAAAMQQFQDSPGQDFLREEQERAVLRNSAATGGTQGGAVLEELQRRAFGRAGTAFNDRISQLGGLGSQGLTASQGQAGIMSDAGRALSGLAERGSSNIANTRLGVAGQQADIQGDLSGLMERGAGNLATAGLNVAGQQAGIRGDLSGLMERGAGNLATAGLNVAGQQANIQDAMAGLAERRASNLASTGLGVAGQQAGIQGTIAGGRARAGEILSQNIGSTTANLANLQNQQGAALADILSGGQFAEIMANAGITDANTLQQLATLLANVATGQGSQAASLGGIPGVQEQEGGVNRFLSAIPG